MVYGSQARRKSGPEIVSSSAFSHFLHSHLLGHDGKWQWPGFLLGKVVFQKLLASWLAGYYCLAAPALPENLILGNVTSGS